ncbi:MAG: hypothetical protein MJD61_05480, partial [Proteobacteria bacterium]|nr:hypothetical protein [Pseudomonadota bacterium]
MHARGGIERPASAAAVLVGLWIASTASANGRYPAAQQVIEDARDPDHLIVRATYGLLVTRNGGRSWSLICEQAVGYGGNEDPTLGLLGDGTLMAGLFDGLALVSADGCSVRRPRGGVNEMQIVDVTVDPADQARGLVLGSERRQAGGYSHRLWQTTDHAVSFQEFGTAVPSAFELPLVTAFDVAPSDPMRIYASVLSERPALKGMLLRSDDGAVTWTLLPIPDTGPARVPFFTAVAASDPSTIYVRVRDLRRDRLLVSTNGGQVWRSVLEGKAVMAGFALSPDGTELAIGFGEPPFRSAIDCEVLGIWKASTQDLVFRKVFSGAVQCLTWTRRGLYACMSQRQQGFEVGLSLDGGQSFGPLMQLRSVEGLACQPPSTLASVCVESWRKLCPLIGTSCGGGDSGVPPGLPVGLSGCLPDAGRPILPPDAGRGSPRDAAVDPDGGLGATADAGNDTGPSDAHHVDGSEDAATAASTSLQLKGGGCGCDVMGRRAASPALWL